MLIRILVVASLVVFVQSGHSATQTLRLNDPTDRVVVQHDSRLNPGTAITIEAWIRPTSVGCNTIVGKDFVNGYWFGLCGGDIRYYPTGDGAQINQSISIPTFEWTHVAVSYDRATVRFYVNGESVGTGARSGSMPADTSTLGIGGEGTSSGFPGGLFPFEGWMSEVRIWNYARSIDELRDAMYRQLTTDQPGLVGVWALEGGPEDRFGEFDSVLSEAASFSTLDSPAVPHEPLVIRNVGSVTADGVCDNDYTAATAVPQWYESGDLAGGERNPMEILLGANSTYLHICLPNRSQLNDPIWTVEIDTDNDGGSLDNNDWQFRLWPSETPDLVTRRGFTSGPPLNVSTWQAATNPSGLFASEELGVEFVYDMEWRIPRSIFSDPDGIFKIRVAHNYLVGTGDRTTAWPPGSGSTASSTWEEAVIDLTPVGPADWRNPEVWTRIDNDRPRSTEAVEIDVIGTDDVDIELLELLVDDVVVDFMEFPGTDDRRVSFTHTASYAPGNHTYQARAFDHVGREVLSLFKSFRVLVDGQPPDVALRFSPPDPAPGQTVNVTATATDPSGVEFITVREVLGILSPSFRRCDFSGGNETEQCTWSVTPGPGILRLRLDALAEDSEGFLADSGDYVVLFGNSGPDFDDDGLADSVEFRLCTDPFDPDTDRDGLGDGWEVSGIRFAGGEIESLVDYGVNPCWPNVLFQMDWETGSRPPATTFDNLRNRYRENGIAVFLDTNERPRPTAYPQSHIGAVSAAYQQEDGEYYFDPRRVWAFYYGYERGLQGRSGAWNRFFTMDHFTGTAAIENGAGGFCSGGDQPGKDCRGDFECPGSGASCEAGCIGGDRDKLSCATNRDCPKDDGDFAVCAIPCTTLPGAGGVPCAPIGDIPTRLMHELGHTVGLGHGGNTGTRVASSNGGLVTHDFEWDNDNYKPNHQSIMNYGQWGGALCVEPFPGTLPTDFRPTVVGQINYTVEDLGDLDESRLSESFSSEFARNLRDRDCALASPTAIPVVEYNCVIDETKYKVWSDGSRTIARRPDEGDWDFDPPAHGLGIDWNCNGVIDGSTVSVDIDDRRGIDETLLTRNEFAAIPNPLSCQIMYRANCADRAASCYLWPPAYRLSIGALATGVNPVDCRDNFLAARDGSDDPDCRGGSDAEFGTGTCPLVSLDTPVSAALPRHPAEWGEGEPLEPQPESETPSTDGIENCDLADNDGDGQIDEGCADSDSDGVPDAVDNCPATANADQADRDGDGLGEACQFPTVSGLAGAWNGAGAVNLSWNAGSVPVLGYVVYRYGERTVDDRYLGSVYPTTAATSYSDLVSDGDTFTYVVRPVNLNGDEGDPATVNVLVDIPQALFRNGFENP